MSSLTPTEIKFEQYIESQLQQAGYQTVNHSEYDRNHCLIKRQLIDFIRSTQSESWGRLTEIYGDATEHKVLTRIAQEVASRGIIDVLRNQVVDCGVYLNLCYFQPKSDLNPDHRELFKQNKFSLIRQLRYSQQNENSIDMVLFLNGLPIVTMELKNLLTGQNFKHAENQYKNDRNQHEPLLKFKRCLVHFCVDNNKVSMTTQLKGENTRFLPYNRDIENPEVTNGYRTEYLWQQILNPNTLLDILENFVHLSKEKQDIFNDKTQKLETKINTVLIFPRYHQFNLIHKFKEQLRQDGVGTNYLVQHTTGSGKSYSIGWLAHTLASFYRHAGDTKRMFDSIIVVTDRTVLDDQLRNTIRSLEKIAGVVSGVEAGSQQLQQFLETGKDIIITTIQKFPFISQTIAALGKRTFGVIIDEVHSSQSGELSKELKKSLSKTANEDEFDYEEMLRQEIQNRGRQPHISFFGFTGTPKDKTLEIFGTTTLDNKKAPFHSYSMKQSIYEGFTLDVLENYITYKRYFKVKQTKDGDIEIPSGKGKKELIRYVDSHKITISNKVQLILDHWITKGSKQIQGKARGMIVTQSRKHCVKYFDEINLQLKERNMNYRCLVGFSGELSIDGDKYTEASCNQTVDYKGNVPLGLKNPKYRLLVVANKFQTGFNEPLMQSMYVDKKLGDIQCVQTLSRLNRTTSGKTATFVLDFINDFTSISSAFQKFYQVNFLEGETDPNRLYDLQRQIFEFHLYTHEDVNNFCKIFYDRQRDEGSLHPILDKAVDKFKAISDDVAKEDFRSSIQSYIRMYGYLAQIINFTDIELEKSFIFLKYLNKKLPKRQQDTVDIADAVDLDSLRIQKIHENTTSNLINEDSIINPPSFDTANVQDPEYDFLSEIINQVNNKHGVNLTEEDRIDLSHLHKRMEEDHEIKKYMHGDNSENNKRNFFKTQFDKMLPSYVNDRFDFYKKLDDNPSTKDLILKHMYNYYNKHDGLG